MGRRMNAPVHIRGPMLKHTPLHLRSERYRWVMIQREGGASFDAIGSALGISRRAASLIAVTGPSDQLPNPALQAVSTRYEVSFRKSDGSTGKHVVAAPTQEAAEARALRPYPGAVVVGVKRLGAVA